jgi:hypothetical protein
MAVLAQWCVSITFRDAKGQTRRVTVCLQTDDTTSALDANLLASGVSNVVNALQTVSNAHVQSEANFYGGGSAQSGFTYGSTGNYQSVSQQAVLYFITANPDGDPTPVGSITIPAPKAEIFEADLVTVNPANADIVTLISALNIAGSTATGYIACTKSGLLYSTFVGGVLRGKKLSRRWTKFTKDPTLTIAGI